MYGSIDTTLSYGLTWRVDQEHATFRPHLEEALDGPGDHRCRAELEARRTGERLELAQKAGRSVAWEWHVATDSIHFSSFAAARAACASETLPGDTAWRVATSFGVFASASSRSQRSSL